MTDPRSVLTPERERLIIRLLYEARRLAQSRINTAGRSVGILRCAECMQVIDGDDFERGHQPNCRTAAVVDTLVQLGKTENEPKAPSAERLDGQSFAEPWRLDESFAGIVRTRDGYALADLSLSDLACEDEDIYARRIVACVNFCAGIATEDLAKAARQAREVLLPLPERMQDRPALRGVDAVFGAQPDGCSGEACSLPGCVECRPEVSSLADDSEGGAE